MELLEPKLLLILSGLVTLGISLAKIIEILIQRLVPSLSARSSTDIGPLTTRISLLESEAGGVKDNLSRISARLELIGDRLSKIEGHLDK